MSRRRTTDEERELFRNALAGHGPLKHGPLKKAPNKTHPPVKKPRRAVVPSGLDGRTRGKLDRGLLAPDAKLDLHGLTEASAHRSLLTFVHTAHRRGVRLLLIVTGKGAQPSDGPFDLGLAGGRRGVLKTMVPRWLREPPLSEMIADLQAAHRRHGGEGALYVYLRKTG
jgi:DNA-nicking Smr family endonuclease